MKCFATLLLLPVLFLTSCCSQRALVDLQGGVQGRRIIVADEVSSSQEWPPVQLKVKVLGVEITYGENGPPVPVRLEWSSSHANGSKLNQGKAVRVGDQFAFSVPAKAQEIVFRAWTPITSFKSNTINAILVENGDDLRGLLRQRRALGPYGRQKAISKILKTYLNPEGRVTNLGPGQFLVLFELGISSPEIGAYDFQDSVLLVDSD